MNSAKKFYAILLFIFIYGYQFSFSFEGNTLYNLVDYAGYSSTHITIIPIISLFIGLITAHLFMRSLKRIKNCTYIGITLVLILTLLFFITNKYIWIISLTFIGYIVGCLTSTWGYALKQTTTRKNTIFTCSFSLVGANLLMLICKLITDLFKYKYLGLIICISYLLFSLFFAYKYWSIETDSITYIPQKESQVIKAATNILYIFVAIVTINGGLMYQVIIPSFSNLSGNITIYYVLPYIIAVFLMSYLYTEHNSNHFLYLGIICMMLSYVLFTFLGRNSFDYIAIDTFIMIGCGITDLFYMNTVAKMTHYRQNPIFTYGIGLSANVLGVLVGKLIGLLIDFMSVSETELIIIALCFVCISIMILPYLNKCLKNMLISDDASSSFAKLDCNKQSSIVDRISPFEPLTNRECEVLNLILNGLPNKEISDDLHISENTVKTHVRNILKKYDVNNRVELISTVLNAKANSTL